MTTDKINELQLYLQLYDRGLISKKTLLSKIDIVWEDEQKEIERDMEFEKKMFAQPTGKMGGTE